MAEYNVTFRYTAGAGGYAGVMTWTAYKSKEFFDEHTRPFLNSYNQEIVEEGITAERCIELCNETPMSAYIAASLQEATDQKTGEINEEILQMQLLTKIFAKVL